MAARFSLALCERISVISDERTGVRRTTRMGGRNGGFAQRSALLLPQNAFAFAILLPPPPHYHHRATATTYLLPLPTLHSRTTTGTLPGGMRWRLPRRCVRRCCSSVRFAEFWMDSWFLHLTPCIYRAAPRLHYLPSHAYGLPRTPAVTSAFSWLPRHLTCQRAADGLRAALRLLPLRGYYYLQRITHPPPCLNRMPTRSCATRATHAACRCLPSIPFGNTIAYLPSPAAPRAAVHHSP